MANIEEPITTTVSTKGQISLPRTVRQRRNWQAGTRLIVEERPDGVLLKAAPMFPPTRPEQVFASLAYAGAPKTAEEMQEGIAAEARRRHGRDRY